MANVFVRPDSIAPDSTSTINGVTVNKFLLKDHNVNNIALPSKRTNKFKGVIIHNTDRVGGVPDGCQQYSAATLNDSVATRTTYYISEISAWQNLDLDSMNWSCGDGTKGEGNNGCVSLEIIMSSKDKPQDLKSRDNGARLAAYLLTKANMTVNDMYTHNYFLNIKNGVKGDYMYLCTTPTPTRNCPYYIVWDWEGFRKQVDGYIKQLGGKSIYDDTTYQNVQYIYQAVSNAAIRSGMSKESTIYSRVTKGNYYCIDRVYDVDGVRWLKYADKQAYSMLNDDGALFRRTSTYVPKRAACTVNIRAGASTKGKKVGTISGGTIVYAWDEPTIYADGYHWQKIVYEGKTAYIASEYLK